MSGCSKHLPTAIHPHEEDLDDRILEKLVIWVAAARWIPVELADRMDKAKKTANICIVGKYVHLADTYKSLNEALTHGGIMKSKQNLEFVDSETIDPNKVGEPRTRGRGSRPGGFGERAEGKIGAIRWARENDVPLGNFRVCRWRWLKRHATCWDTRTPTAVSLMTRPSMY